MIKLEITADSAADFKKTFEGLAAIITSAPAASAAPAEASKPAAEKPKAEVKPKAEEKAKPAAEKPKDKPKDEPKSEDAPKKVSLDDDLSPLITKLATAGHRDQLVDILGEYGVQRASQVPEEHWADLLEKLQEAVDSI